MLKSVAMRTYSRHLSLAAVISAAFLLAIAQTGTPTSAPPMQGQQKVISGFDITALDTSIKPCANFYLFACGNWKKNNPIPPDEPIWGRFNELAEHNREVLRDIATEVAAKPAAARNAVEQKVGDFYASCMDQKAVEQAGATPLQSELQRIAAINTMDDLADEVARLHGIGATALFDFGSNPDFKNVNEVIAEADQGGLGLPDRDYYTKSDTKSQELRRQYQQHVAKMLQLMGDSAQQAENEAQSVMNIENALAQASLERALRRDPDNVYHKLGRQELVGLTPRFDWNRYFTDVGVPSVTSINVTVPKFFTELNARLAAVPIADWKTYLRWHLVDHAAPMLSSAFVNQDFDFTRTLTGAKELRPRWKRCVQYTDHELGEALGQLYVEKAFPPESKARMLRMVQALEASLQQDIEQLPWMTAATKQQAIIKLHAIRNKIGYPDKWRDYSRYEVQAGDFFGNFERGNDFEFQRQLRKIGKPLDRAEWQMSPPTVNAYYQPFRNEIVFPAGILQPPFFDPRMDDSVNFGAIGAVIGHELTHGFDDQGRKFDPQGNLRDWWTAKDAAEFEKRASCVADEYSSFTPLPDVHLNGKLTLGENTADNGGLRIAYAALMSTHGGKPQPKREGFTGPQRFFLGWGQIWCQNETEQITRLRATVDPHSPGEFRVNGVVSNLPQFQQAFGCAASSPMVRGAKACRVW